MLSAEEVAKQYGLRPDTIRRRIRAGEIGAVQIGRTYRLTWPDVWNCEAGPMPKRAAIAHYQDDLLGMKAIAAALRVSVRTAERWIDDGLPTRNVFGAVRCNPYDATDWLTERGINLPPRLPDGGRDHLYNHSRRDGAGAGPSGANQARASP